MGRAEFRRAPGSRRGVRPVAGRRFEPLPMAVALRLSLSLSLSPCHQYLPVPVASEYVEPNGLSIRPDSPAGPR
jgi:hypothetical protein